MLVVSDTSPIRALSVIDQLGLIPAIYGRVFVPPAVAAELRISVPGLPAVVPAQTAFLVEQAPADARRVAEFSTILGPGEAEAIALALEIQAEVLLLDERRGRAIAERHGLRPVGVLGVLGTAKSLGSYLHWRRSSTNSAPRSPSESIRRCSRGCFERRVKHQPAVDHPTRH